MPWVAVFDTNVLLSALLSLRGNPSRCVALAKTGIVVSVTCQEVLDEFAEKLEAKFSYSAQQARAAASEIRACSRMVEITGEMRGVANDPDDDAVLECAVVAGASHLVTGDRHLLSLLNYRGVAIVTPADFVAIIAAAQAQN